MLSKVKKYIIGFFALAGAILFAFLSGKSAGRKEEKLGGLKNKIKDLDKSIKKTDKSQKALKRTLQSKKEALEEIQSGKYKKKKFNSDETADFLKKYKKGKK